MGSKGRIDSVIDISKIQDEVKSVLSSLESIIDKIESVSDKAHSMKFTFSGAKGYTELHRAYSDYEVIANETIKTTDDLAKKTSRLVEVEALYSKQKQAALNQLAKQEAKERDMQAAIDAEIKSLNDLKAQTNALIAVRNRLDRTTESGKKQFDELTQKINANNTALKKSDADIGNFQRNVGNYASAWEGLGSEFGIFGSILPRVSAGLNLLKVGFTTLKGAIISTGIGALVIAIISLVQWFKNTAIGAETLRKVMVPVNAIFETISETVDAVGGAFAKIFSGNFLGGWQELKGAITGVNAELQKQLVLQGALASLKNLEQKKYLEDVIKTAQLETQISELKEIANNDQEYSLREQIEAITKARKLTEKLYSIKQDEANRAVAAAKLQQQAGADSEEEERTLADAIANSIKIAGEKADALRSLSRRQNSLYEEERANLKASTDAGRKALEETKKLAEESLQRDVAISDLKLEILEKGSMEELSEIYNKLQKQEKLEIFQAEKTGKSVEDIRKKYLKAWTKANLDYSLIAIDKQNRETILKLDKSQEDELQLLKSNLEKKLITLEDYEKEKERITTKYDIRQGELLVQRAKEELEEIEKSNGDTLKAREAYNNAVKALDDLKTKSLISNIKSTAEEEKDALEKTAKAREKFVELSIELGQQLHDTMKAFYDAEFEKRAQSIEAASRKDQESRERDIEAAGNNKELIDQINARYDAKERQRELQRQKLEVEQARAAKKFALFQIAINTAQAIMKIWADFPKYDFGVATIAMSAIAAGIGIAQAAAVAAQPLPKYRTGRKGGPAEWAVVGEAGTEGISYPTGEKYLTPDAPTITFLPRGASVIPHHALVNNPDLFFDHSVPILPGINDLKLREEVAGLHAGFRMVVDAIAGKQEHFWNITERGLQHLVRRGNSWTEYVNKKHRS